MMGVERCGKIDIMQPMLFDSLTEKLTHVYSPDTLTVYVCGVTVYDHCHVGHGRIKIVFDVWRRWMASCGQKICFVSNITDIDDKIIRRAQEAGVSWDVLAQKYIDAMQEDDISLGLLMPDYAPRATDYIPAMITLIQKLFASGHAYVSIDGDVCLAVRQCKRYGVLSKQNIDQLQSHHEADDASVKKDPCDFVLWKKAKEHEPSWPSPWGEGRPGWHLECSAMAEHVLGHPIDIHGGGVDLKFPHHENEIAQSEAAFGEPFARIWMHVGLVDRDGVKMSKSLGNTLLIRDVLKIYGSAILRLFYMKSHYRKPVSWSEHALDEARARWNRYMRVCQYSATDNVIYKNHAQWLLWQQAMADDFNTPQALSIMDHWAKMASTASNVEDVALYTCMLRASLEVYGITCDTLDLDAVWIEEQITARAEAKKNKDFKTADAIRRLLADKGIILEDTKDTTRWYKEDEGSF